MKVLVIGDAGLDTYIHGETSRVSPEAPVVIVNVTREEHRLGMAANVANNLTSFGLSPTLACAFANDSAGTIFSKVCEQNNIKDIYQIENDKTTHKTRIVARNQQIVRVDSETIVSEDNVTEFFQSKLQYIIGQYDVVIVSDYNKGVLYNVEQVIGLCIARNIPVYIDPKSTDFVKYACATLIKPNLREFEGVYGACPTDDILINKMKKARKDLNLQCILVTLGARGMMFVSEDAVYKSKEHKFEVVDISGCGDTVLSAVAYLLTIGYSIQEAIDIANDMGGIVARKAGTSIVLRSDVETEHLGGLIKREA